MNTISEEEIRANNAQYLAYIDSLGSDGIVKGASSRSSDYIRTRIQENGFFRNIIPADPITDDMLTPQLLSEEPARLEFMEGKSVGAKAVPFGTAPDTRTYRAEKFLVTFCVIMTPEFVKNTDLLRSYTRMDLRQVTTDNGLRDMETEEDTRLIATADRIVGSTSGVGLSGSQQNFLINGRIQRSTWKELNNPLMDADLNNGVFLVNRRTMNELLGMPREEIGGDLAETLFTEGLKGLPKNEMFGVPYLATIKRMVVPNNVVYHWAEVGYLGKAYELSKPTMYVEKKVDTLRFHARSKLGFTLANVAGVARTEFSG